MKTAVIVDSVRTGLAKSHRGGFNMTRPDDMLAHIINGMLDRNPNLPPEMVEDVIMGCGNPEGAMGHNIGRNAAVLSNLPLTVGGTTVNRYCSSGLQSISMAASQIMAGCYDTVIAGGVEQISMLQGKQNMEGFVNEKLAEQSPGIYHPMGITAETVAKRYDVSRESQDEYALASHKRTANAQDLGLYDDEIVPMETKMLLVNKETGDSKEVDYTVDKWTFTVGMRDFELADGFKSSEYGIFYESADNTGCDGTEAVGVTCAEENGEESDNRFKYTVAYEVDDDLTLFAVSSVGYRSGGNNAALPFFCANDPEAAGFKRRYTSDEAENTEIGVKSRGNNYTLNATYFWVDWTGIQVTVRPACGWSFTYNGGEAETSGLELDFSYDISENLVLDVAGSFISAEISNDLSLIHI